MSGRSGWNGWHKKQNAQHRDKIDRQRRRARKRASKRAARKVGRLPDETLQWLAADQDPGRAGAIIVGEDQRPAPEIVQPDRRIIIPG